MSDSIDDSKRFVTKTVVLKPGAIWSIAAGAYQNNTPAPRFTNNIEPNSEADVVVVKEERLDIPGTSRYTILFQLHNFGHKECTVTINRRSSKETTN